MRTMYLVVLLGSEGVGDTGAGSIGMHAFWGRASTRMPWGRERQRKSHSNAVRHIARYLIIWPEKWSLPWVHLLAEKSQREQEDLQTAWRSCYYNAALNKKSHQQRWQYAFIAKPQTSPLGLEFAWFNNISSDINAWKSQSNKQTFATIKS